jgi:hypothetical protein
MITLTNPVKAFLVLFFITISVQQFGLKDTVLTTFLILGAMFIYQIWVKKTIV